MIKFLITNEKGVLEILYSERIYVDPKAPTDIIIRPNFEPIKIRIRFRDTEEVESFMRMLFECDAMDLNEIERTNPDLEMSIEDTDEEMEQLFAQMADLDGLFGYDDEEDNEDDE
jgi:hypothetical protein